MSYTTRCPACGTTFRIVADQLKISDGWVRCGHCSDVFDATLYLDEWADGPGRVAQAAPPVSSRRDSPAAPEPVRAPQPAGDDPGRADADPMGLPDRISDALTRALFDPAPTDPVSQPAQAKLEPVPGDDGSGSAASPGEPSRGFGDDFHAELLQFAAMSGSIATSQPEPAEVPAAPSPEARIESPGDDLPGGNAPAPGAEDMVPAEEEVPGFVQQARRRAFWRRPGVRFVLSLVMLGLVTVLLAQGVRHERHRLLAWQPGLEPVVRLLCAPPACDIEPPRRIEDIVIDSTALVRRLDDLYAFDIVLKNRSGMAIAVPAVELTLTDLRDQAIARRVFLPQDWPVTPQQLPAFGEVSVSLRLSIDLGDNVPMTGYRALVFYP